MSGTIRSRTEAIKTIAEQGDYSLEQANEMLAAIADLADDTLTDLNNAPDYIDAHAGVIDVDRKVIPDPDSRDAT